MLRRLAALFHLYAAHHLSVSLPGPALCNSAGRRIGHVDRVAYAKGRLRVEGWAEARGLRLVLGGASASGQAALPRPDVAASGFRGGGFRLSVPALPRDLAQSAPPGLVIQPEDGRPVIPDLSLPRPALPLWPLLPGFLLRLARALPAALAWRRTRDPRCRARVKAILGLAPAQGSGPLLPGLIRAAPEAPVQAAPDVTIVLPVHNGFALLPQVLKRIARHTDLPWRLILIEDASTDPRVRPFLQEWATDPRRADHVQLIETRRNLGFIGAVNLGFARALERPERGPVLLLNSDAFLPPDWARRLLAPLAHDPSVASVTPASNAAEILSVPAICREVPLRPGMADRIDATAARLDPQGALAPLPTGVGFCMAIARPWLARLPRFDTAFGRGYGEEVDWCRRIAAQGGRHLGHAGVFVEHQGGASFGPEKAALLRRNGARLRARYPGFDAEVAAFKSDDPLGSPRFALALAWAAEVSRPARIEVIFTHSLGGGVARATEARIQRALAAGRPALRVALGGPDRFELTLFSAWGRIGGATPDAKVLAEYLSLLPAKDLVYACGVGDADPLALPGLIAGLLGPEDRAELELHDYFPLSPSYTLCDSTGTYRGLPAPGDRDPAHQARRPDGTRVPLTQWRAAWHGLAARAQITCFSEASADLLREAWPDLAPRITLRPHRLALTPAPLPRPTPGNRPVIGVLGAISLQKGAPVVAELARLCGDDLQLTLIGEIAPGLDLPAHVTRSGAYDPEDIAPLARARGVTHWLIPSLWPETFCFALHEALATGLPVLGFDLGAQGASLAAAPNGTALPYHPGAPDRMAQAVRAAVLAAPAAEARRAAPLPPTGTG
ncbi:glycosyltransferase [Roseivivax sp.]